MSAPISNLTKYVIITRYNLRMGFTPGNLNLDEGWLQFRLETLKRTALPSVSGQTVPSDEWWILIDPATPSDHLDALSAALRDGCAVPWKLIPLSSGIGSLGGRLAPHVPTCDRLCTIRLDSDDCLESFYVEEVARWSNNPSIRRRQDAFGSFPVGRIETADGDRYLSFEASGPFMVRCEAASGPVEMVGAIEHHLVQKNFRMDHISLRPAWTQIVHGRNISNAAKGVYLNGLASPKFYLSLLKSPLLLVDWLSFLWYQGLFRAGIRRGLPG